MVIVYWLSFIEELRARLPHNSYNSPLRQHKDPSIARSMRYHMKIYKI